MVTIAFAAATAGLAANATAWGAAALAAGGVLAAYIDQQFVYPNLFGKKNPKPAALEGFQLSTTDPGAPRWEVYGTRAWVPCHYLWSLNLKEERAGNAQVGKGGGPFTQTMRADVGLATCDGPIVEIDSLVANEQPFWSRQFNRVAIEDNRWTIAAGAGGDAGKLVITATDADVTDFSGIFRINQFVRLENVSPISLLGPYRVTAVTAHAYTVFARIVLQPLRGQTPVAGVAGSIFEPARIRRLDQGAASHTWTFSLPSGSISRIALSRPGSDPYIPGAPQLDNRELDKVWVNGGTYRFGGFTPSSVNGRYRLAERRALPGGTYGVLFEAMDGQDITLFAGAGTLTDPSIIVRDQVEGTSGDQGRGFVYLDETQSFATHNGALDQAQDATLAAIEPDPPAHRGIAHISLANWNLGPHSNTFPHVSAQVKARSGELVAGVIDRICRRAIPDGHVDVSRLRQKVLLGYAVPGGMASGQALQPIQVMYGVVMQDRGGVLTFLDERDLPIVPVATRHLNARSSGERTTARGFQAVVVDDADIPERVVLQYIDPAAGANEAESDGDRAPGTQDRGRRDTSPVDLKPLVVWPYESKRRARELRRRIRMETHRGTNRLPPGYMDVLPGHCVTFRSNNWQEEEATPASIIAHDCELRDLLPRSVVIDVRFDSGQVARLVDDGNGALSGFPAGVTTVVNTVNYATGEIQLLCSEPLDDTYTPRIAYLYEKQWLLRANKATLHAHDFCVTAEMVRTTTDDPLPPVPRDLPTGLGGAIAVEPPLYRVHVLDVPALYPGGTGTVVMHFAAAPEPGAAWRGAFVYQSPNGVDRWSPVGQIQAPTTIGWVEVNNLPDVAGGASTGYVDWATELEVDLPNGELLEDASSEMIALGANWLLVGNEIVGFHEAENTSGTLWILRGLVRGMRQTFAAMDGHADGERAVLLSNIGALHGLTYEPVGGAASANRTYYFRVVPGGGSIDSVSTIELAFRGNSARPAPPQVDFSMVQQRGGAGGDMRLTWLRRSIEQTTVFGPSPMPPGEIESYRVVAFDGATAAGLIATLGVEGAIAATRKRTWILGDDSMGTPFVHRSVDYTMAELAADWPGHIPGILPVAFVVYQRGRVGESAASDIVFIVPS